MLPGEFESYEILHRLLEPFDFQVILFSLMGMGLFLGLRRSFPSSGLVRHARCEIRLLQRRQLLFKRPPISIQVKSLTPYIADAHFMNPIRTGSETSRAKSHSEKRKDD